LKRDVESPRRRMCGREAYEVALELVIVLGCGHSFILHFYKKLILWCDEMDVSHVSCAGDKLCFWAVRFK